MLHKQKYCEPDVSDLQLICSTSQGIIPPVGFAIISQQFHMVKHLIGLDGFDTSTLGVSSALVAVCAVTYSLPILPLSS